METEAHTHPRYIHTGTKPFQLNRISEKASKNFAKLFRSGCPEAHGDLREQYTFPVSAFLKSNLLLILTHKGTLQWLIVSCYYTTAYNMQKGGPSYFTDE